VPLRLLLSGLVAMSLLAFAGGPLAGQSTRTRSAPPRLLVPRSLTFDGDQRAPLGRDAQATPLRMLREIYPGMTDAGEATRMRAVRGLDPQDQPSEAENESADFHGAASGAQIVRVGDSALLIASGMLVAARIEPRYRFLDAAFVQTDPGGLPMIEHAFQGPAGPVALIEDSHNNSSESFAMYQLVGIVAGRLKLLDSGIFLYSYQGQRRGCPYYRVSQSLSRFLLRPNGVLVATVQEDRTCERETRIQQLGRRLFTIRFVWDGARRAYRRHDQGLGAMNERIYRQMNE